MSRRKYRICSIYCTGRSRSKESAPVWYELRDKVDSKGFVRERCPSCGVLLNFSPPFTEADEPRELPRLMRRNVEWTT